ncbi:MAG: DNA alkylation repair protein [Ferruginibacter sp.]|nr:DNA alkylation repair protein [Chitinophagaceae bacterium]
MTTTKKTPAKNKAVQIKLTAKQFIEDLAALRAKPGADNARFFRNEDKTNKFLGVHMSEIFTLAKLYCLIPPAEIEKLLDSDYYEARMGGVSMMDFQARDKKVTAEKKKEVYNLYIKRHDRINNWDLVDRGAPYIVGGYLFDKSRAILYKLAKSKNAWERRTAIVSTYFFIRQGDIDDTFKIAALLINDKNELVNKAVGSWVREAGKRDKEKLLAFLDRFAATMPRVTLRYAIEKLEKKQKDFYLKG